MLFDASTFGVSILRVFACFLMQYFRRVDFFVAEYLLEFRRKIIDFRVLFDAIILSVSIFSGPRVNAGFVRAATAASNNCKHERSP